MTERLCHGILNIPLRKRGCIDAELDRYKAEQAKIARVAQQQGAQRRKERAERVRAIREQVAQMSDAAIAVVAKRGDMRPRSVRKFLRENAGLDPFGTIKILDWADEQAVQGNEA